MKRYITILFIIIQFGCEQTVEIDVPFEQEQLCVNTIFNPDSLWSADVSVNRFILNDSPFKKVENAMIIIYRDNLPIDTLQHRENGFYKSDSGKPLIGSLYEMKVSAEKYKTVTSESSIPFLPAQLNSIDVIFDNGNINNMPVTTFKLSFKDEQSAVNYYQVLIKGEYEHYNFQTKQVYTNAQPLNIESTDPAIDNENINTSDGILIKDILFNGKDAVLSFKSTDYTHFSSIVVTLRSVSEEYYKYNTTLQLQKNTSGNPFAQPVSVFNNIQNGFGIFAGYSQSTFKKQLPRPIITNINPMTGKPGDHVIISGENLLNGDVIFQGDQYGAYSQLVRSTENEFEIIIPNDAITGKIIIETGGGVTVSDDDFVVLN